MRILRPSDRILFSGAALVCIPLLAGAASAHEAWLLTPAEIEKLAAAPMPEIFTSHGWLTLAAALGCAAVIASQAIDALVRPHEMRLAAHLSRAAAEVGPLALRMCLAVMLTLAALGGLPRHGTAPWEKPTLFVPDMQLALAPGWEWLQSVQLAMAVLLLLGLATRALGLGLVALSALGCVAFGSPFLSYAPHFAAPGLMLAVAGAGAFSCDTRLGLDREMPLVAAETAWRVAICLIGACFVYLAVFFKLTQPTLIIAILEHGSVPTFGLPYPVIALGMTGIEIVLGLLLVMGRLVRIVAVAMIGAITFLAVTLGETPLFHANLYGAMMFLALCGPRSPHSVAVPMDRRVRRLA